MAARKKTGRAKAKPSAPKIEAGANRRAVAQNLIRLNMQLEKIEAQESLLRKQKKNLVKKFKSDTGRSEQATMNAIRIYRMDPVVRSTYLRDSIEGLEDLGLSAEMGTMSEAAQEASVAADQVQETLTPGFQESLGRRAFREGRTMNSHGYPSTARAEIERFERGFTSEAEIKEQEARKAAAPRTDSSASAGE